MAIIFHEKNPKKHEYKSDGTKDPVSCAGILALSFRTLFLILLGNTWGGLNLGYAIGATSWCQ